MRLRSPVVPRSLRHPARWAALATGAAVALLAFPAPDLFVVAWFGLVPGLLIIRRSPSAREAAVRGWWLGCGYIVAAMYWLPPGVGPGGGRGGAGGVRGPSQCEPPAVLALASVGGVWLVSLVLVASNVAIVIMLTARRW